MKIAFVNFANGWYIPVQEEFTRSLMKHEPAIAVFPFQRFEDIGSPSHSKQPYAFKVYAIEYVKNLGYDIVIWCDSPIRLIKPISDWIPLIETIGVYLQKDGWTIGQWANDHALNWFGVTREEVIDEPNCYACVMAFDFRTPIANTFFTMWKQALDAGIFNGKWKNDERTESKDERCLGHRHDQTAAELTAYKLGIELQPKVIGNYFKQWD